MRKWLRSGLAAGPIALAALAASAALSSGDRNFVQTATSSGLAEVATAQLAQQRSASAQVRKFADRMIADHTQANSELQQIVEQEDITLPTQPVGKDAAAEARLRSLNGAAFDRAYLQAAVSYHQQAIALFSREASSGQDSALKTFAQQTLPTLQQHLQLAQSLNSSITDPTASSGRAALCVTSARPLQPADHPAGGKRSLHGILRPQRRSRI